LGSHDRQKAPIQVKHSHRFGRDDDREEVNKTFYCPPAKAGFFQAGLNEPSEGRPGIERLRANFARATQAVTSTRTGFFSWSFIPGISQKTRAQ
jgi:hypothetical protein